MFILKTFFYPLFSIRMSDLELFSHAMKHFSAEQFTCPKCGILGSCTAIREYDRVLVYIEKGNRKEAAVKIPLLECSSCGKQHAALPDVFIPFGNYSLRFVITVLYFYYKKEMTVAALCERWGIAVSTLYAWIHRFEAQFSEWLRLCSRALSSWENAIMEVLTIQAFPSLFHLYFRIAFIQQTSRKSRLETFIPPPAPGIIP